MNVRFHPNIWRCLWLAVLLITLPLAFLPSDFFSRRVVIGHDTHTYTNVPGITKGLSLANFSSVLRTPGFSLFLFLTTQGEIPNPNAIIFKHCGQSIFREGADCAQANAENDDFVTVTHWPFIYSFTKRSEWLFQRTIVITKALLLLSCILLYWALSGWINPILSCFSVLFVFYFIPLDPYPSRLDVLQTECLYPTLFFLYLASLMMHIRGGRFRWLVFSSCIAATIFLVRPAFLYVPVIHLLFVVYFIFAREALSGSLIGGLIVASSIVWVFLFSPVDFFSIANHSSQLLRTAMFSDQRTVECVKDEDIKALLAAYINSINTEPTIREQAANIRNDVDRYYVFALANIYRLNLPNHPIYKDGTISPLLNGSGLLPADKIERLAHQASRCNLRRQTEFFILISKMTLGLTPVLTPHAPRNFFNHELAFYVSFLMIVLALIVQIYQRRYWMSVLISLPVSFYFLMLFIVSAKQGGEARYMSVVEPLYVLGTAMAVSCPLQTTPAMVPSEWSLAERMRGVPSSVFLRFGVGSLVLTIAAVAAYLFWPVSGLQIRAATYGGSCGAPHGNATRDIANQCGGRWDCKYVVDVDRLRDPAPGCAKDFTVEYSCAPDSTPVLKNLPAEAGFKSELELSCRAARAAPAR
jgi:hypothetical protein